MRVLIFAILSFVLLYADENFAIINKGDNNGPSLLVIAGIQGDEAGGYMAANLLSQRYDISNGRVVIVPNLNKKSILYNHRGINGDMNRKFREINKKDPDFEIVESIKKIILDPHIDLILHLHDGSGFFRPKYINELENPSRWGQSSIIDVEKMNSGKYSNLGDIALFVVDNINKSILKEKHKYHVKNVNTPELKSFEQQEMAKALTYFSVINNKPALANEASKELSLEERVYYHLSAIESYLKFLKIDYIRDFDLTPNSIKKEIYANQYTSLYGDRFYLPLEGLRSTIGFVPFKKGGEIEYKSSTPLIVLKKKRRNFELYYGSKKITTLMPEYLEFDNFKGSIPIVIDGKEVLAEFGKIYEVNNYFNIKKGPYRVNAIGYIKNRLNPKESEDSVDICHKNFINRFSIDKAGRVFRVEFYDKNRFLGMFLIRFLKNKR